MLAKIKEKKSPPPLAVPLSLKILKKCIARGVPSDLIRHLHFYDLQCLLIQFDIQDAQSYLDHKEKERLQKRGISEVRDISGAEAIKFLGR